jgi:hypothetical protein
MAAKSELEKLHVQKRLLVAKSQIYRQTMEVEVENLRQSTAWITRTAGIVRKALPILLLGAPIAGYFAAKKRHGLHGIGQKAMWGMGILRQLSGIWRGLRMSRRSKHDEELFSDHFRPG